MGVWPFFLRFSISAAIFRPFQAGGNFPFFSRFPWIFAPDRFPILQMATADAMIVCKQALLFGNWKKTQYHAPALHLWNLIQKNKHVTGM